MNLDDLLAEPAAEREFVHFFAPVTIPGASRDSAVCIYGDEIEITPEIREAGIDRLGRSWLDVADKPQEQERRWGRVRYALGRWPADLPRLEPGSMEENDARAKAYRDAWTIADDTERAAAQREVRALWGQPPTDSKTLGKEPNR